MFHSYWYYSKQRTFWAWLWRTRFFVKKTVSDWWVQRHTPVIQVIWEVEVGFQIQGQPRQLGDILSQYKKKGLVMKLYGRSPLDSLPSTHPEKRTVATKEQVGMKHYSCGMSLEDNNICSLAQNTAGWTSTFSVSPLLISQVVYFSGHFILTNEGFRTTTERKSLQSEEYVAQWITE